VSTSFTPRGIARLAIGIASGFVALALAAGPVLADTELGHHGKVGAHSLNEAQDQVTCDYDSSTANLESIKVAAPTIYARNRTAGEDLQMVGWRILVRRKVEPATSYTTVLKSAIFKTEASDITPAAFKEQTVSMAVPDNSSFRIFVKMFWYRPDNSIAGTARHRVDKYTEWNGVDPASLYPFSRCTNRYGI
jgi:hypothetical protein